MKNQDLVSISEKLKTMNKTLSVAESCTGGLVGKLLTDISGSSGYFKGGIIAYSNKVKIEQLDIPAEMIEKYGAVSSEVAEAMAISAMKKFNSDIAISTTGIAGPTGGTADKKVGLVYVALAWGDNVYVKECNFSGSRENIRNLTANACFNLIVSKVLI